MWIPFRLVHPKREQVMSQENDVLQIVTETAKLEKHDRVTGRVRVSTKTEAVKDLVAAALERTDVEVTRVAIDREIEAMPSLRTEDGVTVVPVVEEILVVEKRLVLREEIHIRKITTTEHVEVPVTLRKQHAVIQRDEVPAIKNEEET